MEKEIWKSVHDIKELNIPPNSFGHTYSVSNTGKVRNNKTQRILQVRPNADGYHRANISNKDYMLHRLVAFLFVENPFPDLYDSINHKDGIKKNNNSYNLEWCTHQQNITHASENGLLEGKTAGERNGRALLTDDQVLDVWINNRSANFIMETYGMTLLSANNLRRKTRFKHLIPLFEEMISPERKKEIEEEWKQEEALNRSIAYSKFTEEQILEIIELMNQGFNNVEISKIYQVNDSSISNIRLQKNKQAKCIVEKYNLTIKQNPRGKNKKH